MPTESIHNRIIGDLIEARPNFSIEEDKVFWSDRDGSTYLVELDVPGVQR